MSATGEVQCSPENFGLSSDTDGGECQCWEAAPEKDAAQLCRQECDRLGERCDSFEYSYNTDIHRGGLGPQCCFQTGARAMSQDNLSATNDCFMKVIEPQVQGLRRTAVVSATGVEEMAS